MLVLSSGLPVSAKGILKEAMDLAFDGAVDIQELNSTTLRSRVRLSIRNVEVVLVVLDKVSEDTCRDIENGLYSSDKYYTYTSDRGLVEFLNGKYNISMEFEDDMEEAALSIEDGVFEVSESELEEYFRDKLKVRDDTIANLEARIRELLDFYGGTDSVPVESNDKYKEELESYKDENIRLKNQILELDSVVSEKEEAFNVLKGELKDERDTLSSVRAELENANRNKDRIREELDELRIQYSKQAGVIRGKEHSIEKLNKEIVKLGEEVSRVGELKKELAKCRSDIDGKELLIKDLRIDLQSKERDVIRYLKELESLKGLEDVNDKLTSARGTIDELDKELKRLSVDKDALERSVNEKDRVISQLNDINEKNQSKIEELSEEKDSLLERVKNDDDSLLQLNKDKLELQSKIAVLEKNAQSGGDNSELLREVQELQNKVISLNNNVFTRLGQSAYPSGAVGTAVLQGNGRFRNIRFVFSGSAESRKGTYKCLMDEIKGKDERYLIVDLVSETSIDYVFEIKNMVQGMEWFNKGGSVQPFISSTVLKNVQVLSTGLGYVNDGYFLCIDWAKRLVELENSGYKVILFCGDISNLVGRVLFESFVGYGESMVYVNGGAIGSRAIIRNLRGLANSKESIINYFDFSPTSQRFFDIVAKSNDCRVISTKGSTMR